MPHVQADDLTGLARGHGYVTWTARWTPKVLRRRPRPVPPSCWAWTCSTPPRPSFAADVVGTARRWWEAASAPDREFFAAYARGISEALARVWAETPEVREAGLTEEPPRPWDPWTPIAVHLDAHLLTGSLPSSCGGAACGARAGEAWVPVLDAESPAAAGSSAWPRPGSLRERRAAARRALHRVVEGSGRTSRVPPPPRAPARGLALAGLPGVCRTSAHRDGRAGDHRGRRP
ncbi:hypothetical protein QJS66_01375 [Kocuria rhizophila]|nr:hypothetical protein QJS66_01375 [Kocuria rhizophila]